MFVPHTHTHTQTHLGCGCAFTLQQPKQTTTKAQQTNHTREQINFLICRYYNALCAAPAYAKATAAALLQLVHCRSVEISCLNCLLKCLVATPTLACQRCQISDIRHLATLVTWAFNNTKRIEAQRYQAVKNVFTLIQVKIIPKILHYKAKPVSCDIIAASNAFYFANGNKCNARSVNVCMCINADRLCMCW